MTTPRKRDTRISLARISTDDGRPWQLRWVRDGDQEGLEIRRVYARESVTIPAEKLIRMANRG